MQLEMFADPPERNLSKGEMLKIQGMQTVIDNQGEDWSTLARHLMLIYISENGPCLMEDARAYALECGLPSPKHPNAWGAAAGALSKSGDIEMTGQWSKSESVKSHARIQPMWRTRVIPNTQQHTMRG